MAEFSKSEKKSLRDLAGTVYEAEARLAWDELDAQFERWRRGNLLGSALIAAIHEFNLNQRDGAWVGDITYVATDEGWLYRAAVMDVGSRRIFAAAGVKYTLEASSAGTTRSASFTATCPGS